MIDECPCKTLIAGQAISHAERKEMLMSVQFPNDLLIARLTRIKIVELFPVLHRRPLCREGFAVPVDAGTDIQAFESHQVDAAIDYVFGRFNDLAFFLRAKIRLKSFRGFRRIPE